MAILPWPNPIPGQPDQIIVDGMPLQLVPGRYSVEEADRFGEKVSQGTLKYADFNPYESAHAVAAFTGGAACAYTDAGDTEQGRHAVHRVEQRQLRLRPRRAEPAGQPVHPAWRGQARRLDRENWRSNMSGEARRGWP